MRREMFGDVVKPSITVGSRHRYTVPLSVLTHAVVFGLAVIVPLLATDMLPTPQSVLAFAVIPPAPPPPQPPPPPAAEPRPAVVVSPDAAPIVAPSVITLDPPPAPSRSYSLSDAVGVEGGVPGGTRGALVVLPAPPAPAPQPTGPVRPGGDIKPPTKIRDAKPLYPAIAIVAQVEGSVTIEAIITKDGTVRDAKVVRSVPLLDQAALDAVRRWRYTPTTLNGVPVEVIMTVTVQFSIR